MFDSRIPNILNGFRSPNLDKIANMVCFFAEENKPFTTALNKLVFYADFGHFKRYGFSISGIYYKAINLGPVPENYGGIYNCVVNSGIVNIEENDFGDYIGERFICATEFKGQDHFTETELDTLKNVAEKFKDLTSKAIVKLSHDEPGWKNNIEEKNRISYEYSFDLKHID